MANSGRSAWLITWESAGAHAPPPLGSSIAGVLSSRLGPETVRVHVERLYIAFTYTAAEMLDALPPRGHNPYAASFGTIGVEDGIRRRVVPYTGQIICGHNPSLYGRLVPGLRAADGTYEDGSPRLAWQEHVRPNLTTRPV